jgi:uncharacterized protein (TIGR00375 family)
MKFVADLHLHSSYARATSKDLNFDTLSTWAKWKGIDLLSSADFTHPIWWQETKSRLKEGDNEGIYSYNGTKFVLGTEISCIYSQGGKVRRIHLLLFFPNFADVDRFNLKLAKTSNLKADGRPIIGTPAKQLLEMALEINPQAIVIPAHAWTPWFSLYGSNSGFDSIEECFGELSKYIYAIETGLSSDPAMNWRIKDLDSRSIVSFSDAHSAPKMGRELTIFDAKMNYPGLLEALRQQQIVETIEFFPEEGKYHFDGHRNCDVKQSPSETDKVGIICRYCKKKLTIGVLNRVTQLAEKDRLEDFDPGTRPRFRRLVPLLEILAETLGKQVYSQEVREKYKKLILNLGSEVTLLLNSSTQDIERIAGSRIAQGVDRVRAGQLFIDPGFDGVYGRVKIWPEGESKFKNSNENEILDQMRLFEY